MHLNQMIRTVMFAILSLFCICTVSAEEELTLDIISYENLLQQDSDALSTLKAALHEKGIVGIRNVPGYKEAVHRYIEAARKFSAFSEDVKNAYAPDRDRGDLFLGYERGKERFKRPDGSWVIDDQKISYYAHVPDVAYNIWPVEMDLQSPFQKMGSLMAATGELVMREIGLIGPETGVYLDGVPKLGRMLHYSKSGDTISDNPFWCGAHFDHGLFTALIPAAYFVDGEQVSEPKEAGLYVKTRSDGNFKKVVCHEPEVLMFQVGEFGQLASDDAIRATEHLVHKASGDIERYTLALFFDAPFEKIIHSHSELTKDSRYGGNPGDPCSYEHWNEMSFKRYLVQEEQ